MRGESHPAFERIDHRPWPLPERPWAWRQTWHELAFLHWPVASSVLRPLVPTGLAIDECEGSAWVGVTPFRMSGVTLRKLPAVPGISRFPELNVRTYVRRGDRPGVWFFSLDAGSRLAVLAARQLFLLPYHYARMSHRSEGGGVEYRSERPGGPQFHGFYRPTGPAAESRPGTREYWLTERYCLYAQARTGRFYRAEIHHLPWPLQPGMVRIDHNDMLSAHGIGAAGSPVLVHFAARLEVVVWALEAADSGALPVSR